MVNVLSYILLPSFNGSHTIDPTFTKTVSRLLCRWIPGTPSLQLERNESANLIELGVSTLPPSSLTDLFQVECGRRCLFDGSIWCSTVSRTPLIS